MNTKPLATTEPAAPSTPRAGLLHARVSAQLLRSVQQGLYPIGSVLPKELELAKQLGISRATLRQALQHLEATGIVSRTRRVGTRVVSSTPQPEVVQRMDDMHAIFELAAQTQLHVRSADKSPCTQWPQLSTYPNSTGHWLHLQGVRYLRGTAPAQPQLSTWTEIVTDYRHAGITAMIKEQTVDAVYPLIGQLYGLQLHSVRHHITACALPTPAAQALALPVGHPMLQVQAWLTTHDGQLIEYVRSLHNPALLALELSANFCPAPAA